ncbi:sulfotransferase family protein [Rosistilla oblonga]|uniref:sulfotransferase family protein n=1 Tax=Rosistilla oblonga TaxID=2527990 RepID=UPI003A985966
MLPSFLIIGSMKSGTTTLYSDLATHPKIWMPEVKEPDGLLPQNYSNSRRRAKYQSLFSPCPNGMITGEASTSYTKLPTYQGVPENARALLGEQLRVIYLVRDPIARAVSHHDFLYRLGHMPQSADQTLVHDRTLVEYSNYQMQLGAWLKVLTREQITVIPFEEYITNREGVFARTCRFLNIEATPLQNGQVAKNQSNQLKPLPTPLRVIRDSKAYLWLHEKLPGSKRSKMAWIRNRIPSFSKPSSIPFSAEGEKQIVDELLVPITEFCQEWNIPTTLWPRLFSHDNTRTT